jgi:hypothetical protein
MKIKVYKNKTVVDANNEFTYVIELYDDAGKLNNTNIVKVPPTKYMTPDDSKFTVVPTLNQVKFSMECKRDPNIPTDPHMPNFTLDNCEIEEVLL